MHYWEDPEHARALRMKVLALMDEHGIASTPTQYEIWFGYVLGQNRELKRELDVLLANGGFRNAKAIQELHHRFFSRTDQRVEEANSRIQTELTQLASALATVGEGAAEYGRALGNAGDELARTNVNVDVRGIIEKAAGATALMEQRNKVLEQQVETSSRELAILRTQLEAVRHESLTDSLTGLANRRAFDDRISIAVKDSAALASPLCVLMCDIDRFKLFNDTWGHATGDQVLNLVASVLRSNVKSQHLASRYGGEELAVVLPGTSLADAITIAEQIRAAIEAKKVIKKSTGESLGQITVSIGVAQFVAGESIQEFVGRADRHLYMAKQSGRNRVCWVGKHGAGVGKAGVGAVNGPGDVQNASQVELEFADRDTPLIVDASVSPSNPKLVQLMEWWKSFRSNDKFPQWRDDLLGQIDFIGDHVHIYDVDEPSGEVCVRFVGAEMVAVLGENPTGLRYSLDSQLPANLRTTAERIYELLSLTRQMKAPLRAYSKAARTFGGQRLASEVLMLPFWDRGRDCAVILGATMFSPVSAGADGAAA
jgi:diguanylate cyclase